MKRQNKPVKPGNKNAQGTQELAQRSDLLQLLVNSIKDYAILFLDNDGTVLTWSSAAERLKGCSRSMSCCVRWLSSVPISGTSIIPSHTWTTGTVAISRISCACFFIFSSLRRRSVRSRVTLPNPTSLPSLSRSAQGRFSFLGKCRHYRWPMISSAFHFSRFYPPEDVAKGTPSSHRNRFTNCIARYHRRADNRHTNSTTPDRNNFRSETSRRRCHSDRRPTRHRPNAGSFGH